MKKFKLRKCLFYSIIIVLIGCAGNYPAPPPKMNFSPTSRVGIINMIEDKITHVHVGTTVFNNFSKKYDFNFNFPLFVESELIQNIKNKCNYEVIKIPPTQKIIENKDSLISYSKAEKKVFLNPTLAPEFDSLSKQFNVNAFLVMRTYSSMDYIANSSMRLDDYGLYTRSVLGFTGGFSYANLIIQGISANPPTFIGGEDFNYLDENRGGFINVGFKFPNDIKNLSVSDMLVIDKDIKEKSKGVAYRVLEKTNLIPQNQK